MTQILERPPTLDQAPLNGGPSNGWLATDYLRRIHWWVRLFGVLCLTGMALWIMTLLYFVGQASNQS